MSRKTLFVLTVILVFSFVLSACNSATTPTASEPTSAPTLKVEEPTKEVQPTATSQPEISKPESQVQLPEVDPAAVTGDFTSAGSSTVFPLSEAVETLFENEGYSGQHTIASVGTGGGFERFCKTGETDVSNASRKIKDSEIENCTAIGRTPIPFQVGLDAMAVVVSSENDFVTDVTSEELAKIFSKDATLWSDVRPEWPAEPIQRFIPGTDSGTFDFFVEFVMNPVYVKDATADAGKGEEASLSAANQQASEDDNVLVQGVEGSPYAIGYFGYAYFKENQGNLKAISVNGVAPSEQTAESGEYILSRPLFIYSDANIMKSKPQVAAYINFFLSRVDDLIGDVGYFPISDTKLNESKQAWLDAMK